MDYFDPTIYAIPGFVLLLLLEPSLLKRRRERGAQLVGFEWRDSLASIGMGLLSLITVTALNALIFWCAHKLSAFRLFDLGEGALGWAVAIVALDFMYYWSHRFEHEMRFFWASHVNHHSSRHYNLTTALRQALFPLPNLLLFPLLALVGIAPWMIMAAAGFNLIYQYWIHTEAVDRMPAWFEALFNTPSHHRVHHGSNPEYLDKNYGGMLIVWDRWFGSFEPERAPVVYGLTKNITSYNLLYIGFHEYVALFRDVRKARGLKHKLALLFRGPGFEGPVA